MIRKKPIQKWRAKSGLAGIAVAIGLVSLPSLGLRAQASFESVNFSTDVTTVFPEGLTTETTIDDEAVAEDNLMGAVALLDAGNIPPAADVNAYFIFENDEAPRRQLLSFDTTVILPGALTAEPRDVVLFDGTGFSLVFDGSSEGIANGAMVNAVSLVGDDLFLSFDTTVALDGFAAEDEDVVSFSTLTGDFGPFFDGSDAGVAPALDIDGYHRVEGLLLVSFDGSGEVGGVSFDDEDILAFDPGTGTWSLAYDGSFIHAAWPAADLDALHARAILGVSGDFDGDSDVDRDDLNIIRMALNTTVDPGDPRDLDGDGRITVLDMRQLTLLCTRPRCATS